MPGFVLEELDGAPALESPFAGVFGGAGFVATRAGLVLRRATRAGAAASPAALPDDPADWDA